MPSAFKDVGHDAAKTLFLPSAGVSWVLSALRAPSSPGPLMTHFPCGLSHVPGRESASWQSVHLLQPSWPREGRLGREWHQRACSLDNELAACTGYHEPVPTRHRRPLRGYTSPGKRVTCLRSSRAPHCRAE